MTHALLFPFWRACFRVVKAGRILVPAPATGHHGQRYDRSRTHAFLLRDANYDTETLTCMRGLHNDEIRFTSMGAIFKPSLQIKVTVYRCLKWMRYISRTYPQN